MPLCQTLSLLSTLGFAAFFGLGCQPQPAEGTANAATHSARQQSLVGDSSCVRPPSARVATVTDTLHGEQIADPYRWLEALEADSPEVKAWTDGQNAFTRDTLDALPCRDALTAEITPLMELGGYGVPRQAGDSVFFSRRSGKQNQPVLCIRAANDAAPVDQSRVLIDPNALSDRGLVSLDWWEPTKDGSLLAFGTSESGSELSTLQVMRTANGERLTDTISGKVSFGGWAPDKSGFVYSGLRDIKDPYSRESRWHILGTDPATDRVIVKQESPSRIPWASITEDGEWFFLGLSDGWQRNDLWVAKAGPWLAGGELVREAVAVGRDGRFEPQFAERSRFVMTVTDGTPRGMLVEVAFAEPSADHWKTLVPQGEGVMQGATRTKHAMLVTWEQDAQSHISIHSLSGQRTGTLELPGIGSASVSASDDHEAFFGSFTSYNAPRTILKYERPKGAPSVWARTEVPVDLSDIEVSQHFATSKDGTRVPYFLVRKSSVTANGDNPCLLYAYGGFNVSLTPSFQATMLPWLDRGGIYVVANLRGGSEYGEEWHRAGMQGNKQNVFDDLYSVAEHLISTKWTTPSRLAVEGGSNGGLLTGVAVTQRPDLFACAISAVPLLDMLRFHQFLIAQYWVPEYGSSETSDGFAVLRAYSPYHNVVSGHRYPSVLFTAGENDSRVHPLHARKMAALMQAQCSNGPDDPIMLWVDRDAGHGQGKPLALRVRDEVDQWSFVMWQTGLCGASRGDGAGAPVAGKSRTAVSTAAN